MAVTIVVLGGSVTAAVALGAQGLELASWLTAPVALIVAVAALFPNDIRRILDVSPATVRRLARTVLCVFIVAVTLPCSGDSPVRTSLGTATSVSLTLESKDPVVVFGRTSDGVGYCSRPDRDWASRWRGPNISRDWRRLDDLTAFASSYGGLEIVGRRGDRLLFGYRDGDLAWHPLERVGDGVTGRPAALEDGRPDVDRRFLAFAPDRSGGVKVFERPDYADPWPWAWNERPTLVPELGRVDGVAAGKDPNGRLVLLLRRGVQLFEMHRAAAPIQKGITVGWSSPRPLRLPAGVVVTAADDPTHAAVDDTSVARALRFAVPTAAGIALLSTQDVTRGWLSEIVLLPSQPTAAARLDTTGEGGDRTTVIVFVRDDTLEYIWRDEKSTWSAPAALAC